MALLASLLLKFKGNLKESVTFLTSRNIYPRHIGHATKLRGHGTTTACSFGRQCKQYCGVDMTTLDIVCP